MARTRDLDPDRLFAVEKLDVFWAAIEFMKLMDPLVPELFRRNSGLLDHLRRATASVIANIGEAASTMRPNERRHFFEYAYRSAGECSAMVIAFDALGAFTSEDRDKARLLLHRIQAMLLRLIQKDRPARSGARQPRPSSAPAPQPPQPRQPP